MYDLRPYQQEASDSVFKMWEFAKKLLLVQPTGCGKTIVFADIARRLVEQGKRVLVLAHRDELIRQAVDKFHRAVSIPTAVEKAGETAEGSLCPVTIGSVQTLCRQPRLDRFEKDHYDAIIIDESHHALADTYRRILDHFSEALVLGVTATPDRADKRNLGQYFDDVAHEYNLREAIGDGWLCPITAQTIPLDIDLSSVRVKAGDFSESDLDSAITPYLEEIATKLWDIAKDRKILVFLPLIKTSQLMADIMHGTGFNVSHIDGKSEDRQQILAAFHHDDIRVLTNSMLLTEGYDEPSIDCVTVLRPTKSRALFCQMIGRGTRIHPGKENLLIPDFLWNCERHSLCRPAMLLAEKEIIQKKMMEIQASNPAKQFGLRELEEMAHSIVSEEREQTLAMYIDANKKRKAKTIDPIWFGLLTDDDDIVEYEPTFTWEKLEATQAQIDALSRAGFDADGMTRGYASKLMDRIIKRAKENLATPKQVRTLQRYEYEDPEKMTFERANQLITQIAQNNWRKV